MLVQHKFGVKFWGVLAFLALAAMPFAALSATVAAAEAEEGQGQSSGAGEFSAPDERGDSGSFENPANDAAPLPVTHESHPNPTAPGGAEDEAPAPQPLTTAKDAADSAHGNEHAATAKPAEEAQPEVLEGETSKPVAAGTGNDAAIETGDDGKKPEAVKDGTANNDDKEKNKKDAVEYTEKDLNYVDIEPNSENSVIEGYIGWKHHNRAPKEAIENDTILPLPDRWRLGMHPNTMRWHGSLLDPYHQNMLKGDYPIVGQSIFLSVVASSDTLIEGHSVPTPAGVTTARPNSKEFFGRPDQFVMQQNFLLSLELFKGETDFKPREWEVRLTPVFNLNYADVEEKFALNIDPRKDTNRLDHQIAFQELFGEYHFRDISPSYDFLSSRTGIQHYNNDFRGFLFDDFEPGVRIFGTYEANRLQFNLAGFEMLEKDTNSGLNTLFEFKDEHVLLANLVRQDTFFKGYNMLFDLGFSAEESSRQYNQNGVIVRPAPIGDLLPHNIKTGYIGWGGDGHIGRFNFSHQFYQAFGTDDHNPLAGRRTTTNAQMFALEASYDYDWMRFRSSFFYASGDGDPLDGKATGFDAIYDNPNFAGGQFSYWVRQGLISGNALTLLKSRNSLLPNLSTSKDEGQSNFVNPGVQIFNFAYDADLTPRLRATLNYNYIQFSDTSSIETLLQQNGIDRKLGHDYGLGITYRPFLNQQVVITGGVAGFTPMEGFRNLYSKNETMYSGFLNVLVRY